MFSFSFLSLLPFKPSSVKGQLPKGCCADGCREILLVKKKCEKPAHPPPSPIKPTVNVCDSWIWMKKKHVVNSSCCVLPATDICLCGCVMRLRLCRRTQHKWPIYASLVVTAPLKHHSWNTREAEKGDQEFLLPCSNPFRLLWSTLIRQLKIWFSLITWCAFLRL